MFCSGKFEADGAVNLSGAQIAGMLGFDGAKLRNQNGDALDASRLTVHQDLLCGEGFLADGTVRLH